MSQMLGSLKIDCQKPDQAAVSRMTDHSEILQGYKDLGWLVVSGDMRWDPSAKKGQGAKKFDFHSTSWKDDPICRNGSTGYALVMGQQSGVVGIDIDDPKLEHNAKLLKMCEDAGAVKQTTRKGVHLLFKYTDKLKNTGSTKLALDIRSDNGLLYCEPSRYIVDGRTYKYKWINLPEQEEDLPEITDAIVDYIITLFNPKFNKEDKKKINTEVRKDNSGIDKAKAEVSVEVEDIEKVLEHIDVKHFDDYSDWIKIGLALHQANLGWQLYDKYSKRSSKYEEGVCYYTYNSFKNRPIDETVTIKTLYWWLKAENPELFKSLINQEDTEEYLMMKAEFEEKNFIIGTKLCHLLDNGAMTFINDSEARLLYANRIYKHWNGEKVVKLPFYNIWIKDTARKEYDRMDFIPHVAKCPDNVYNLYKGLRAEKLEIELTPEEEETLIEPILYHIGTLTNQNSDYFLRWLANIIQMPYKKSQTSVVFRDVNRMLAPGGGTGKNMLIEWFGEKVLGEEYFVVLGNNSMLYDSFTEHLEHKLLVYIEEAKGRDNMKEIDQLKATITSKTKMINRKGVPKYQQNDYTRYVWGTNNDNPLPSYGATPGDRRMWFVDVETTHKDDREYFSKLDKALEDDRSVVAFYRYLKNYETWTSPIDFQTKRPVTKAFIDMRRLNADLILRWVIDRVEKDQHIKNESAVLFKEFQDWLEERNERKRDENHISLTHFVQYLTKNSDLICPEKARAEGEGKYKSSTSHIRLDTNRLRNALIKNLYIKPMEDIRCMFVDVPDEV